MNIGMQLAIGIAALWLVWRFVIKQFSRTEPSESLDDPYSGRSFLRCTIAEETWSAESVGRNRSGRTR
jgi:hypothetical protein